jgi:hypothetical protein
MCSNYQIRYLNGDGSPTLTYFVFCRTNESAIEQMQRMLGLECDRAELWRDDQLVYVERKGGATPLSFKRAAALSA